MGFQIWVWPILRVFWSMCSSANELKQTQMLPLEKTIFYKCWLFCERFFAFTFDLGGVLSFCLSFVNNSWNNVTTPSTNQCFWPHSGQILRHQYGISVAESQTFLLAKRSQWRRARRYGGGSLFSSTPPLPPCIWHNVWLLTSDISHKTSDMTHKTSYIAWLTSDIIHEK